jgi:hypothetical protein
LFVVTADRAAARRSSRRSETVHIVKRRLFTHCRGRRPAAPPGGVYHSALIEPLIPVEHWICRWFGHARLPAHSEWVGGVLPFIDQPLTAVFGPSAAAQRETVAWHRGQLRPSPRALQLAVSRRRGLTARSELIRRVMHS